MIQQLMVHQIYLSINIIFAKHHQETQSVIHFDFVNIELFSEIIYYIIDELYKCCIFARYKFIDHIKTNL